MGITPLGPFPINRDIQPLAWDKLPQITSQRAHQSPNCTNFILYTSTKIIPQRRCIYNSHRNSSQLIHFQEYFGKESSLYSAKIPLDMKQINRTIISSWNMSLFGTYFMSVWKVFIYTNSLTTSAFLVHVYRFYQGVVFVRSDISIQHLLSRNCFHVRWIFQSH